MNENKTKKQMAAYKTFERYCKKASKCRHEKYQVSCMACPERKGCEIQQVVDSSYKTYRGDE